MAFPVTEVRLHNGVPTIVVDGQPMHGMTATSCAFNDPRVIEDFVESGVEIMMIWVEIGLHCWKGPGQYDWSYAEEKLKHFEAHSGDTKWIMRNRVGLLDPWFKHAYPTEVHNPPDDSEASRKSKLSVANIHSSIWRDHIHDLLAAWTTWLEGTRWAERIIGFMINAGATEEWLVFNTMELYQGKYPEVITREFRSWLRKEYKDDVEALHKAWSSREITNALCPPTPEELAPNFDNIKCPGGHIRKGSHIWGPYSLREPLYERPMIDYYHFLNETLANSLISFCRTVKETARTPVICGGFHSYLWWESGVYSYIQEYGHCLIQCLMESEWVDFTSDITSYDARYPGGPSGYLGVPHTHNVHGKLHYTEVDLVTINQLPEDMRGIWANADTCMVPLRSAEPVLSNREWAWRRNYCGRDMEEQLGLLQREHMHNLITGTAYWWFDIRQHDFQPPAIKTCLKHLSDIGKEAVTWDRSSGNEVAFVLSEDSPMFQAAGNGEIMRFELEDKHGLLIDGCNRRWGHGGVPYDIYELHDLSLPDFPGDQYKLFVFVNCAHISDKAAAGLRRWQKDDKVFCWTYAPGVTDLSGLAPDKNSDLIGMRLGWRNQRQQVHVVMDEGVKHPLTVGGASLDFGTEGSVGPVFFANDPAATILGHLRDGGEPAFAVRNHEGWRSVYLSMLNFGPGLLRNLTTFSGAHVYTDQDDVVYANRSILCLHTSSSGTKKIRLPKPAILTDLWTGKRSEGPVDNIVVDLPACRTMAWRTEYA